MRLRDLIEGAAIFARYAKDGDTVHIGGADHDVIYFLSDYDLREPISVVDHAKLDALGYHRDEDGEGWAHYA